MLAYIYRYMKEHDIDKDFDTIMNILEGLETKHAKLLLNKVLNHVEDYSLVYVPNRPINAS